MEGDSLSICNISNIHESWADPGPSIAAVPVGFIYCAVHDEEEVSHGLLRDANPIAVFNAKTQ